MEAIVSIDEQGRMKLPAQILNALHLSGAGELRAHASGGKLELTPLRTPLAVAFVEEKGVLVAANSVEFDALAAIQAVCHERL